MYPFSCSINPQGSNFSQSFLEFVHNVPSSLNEIFTRYLTWHINSLDKVKISKSFTKLIYFNKLYENLTTTLDVSSSAFQIISGIVGWETGLVKTNFFVADTSLKEAYDFYTDFTNSLNFDFEEKLLERFELS